MSAHDAAVEAAAKVRAAEEYEKPWEELKPEQRAWCLRAAWEMQAAYHRHMRAAGFVVTKVPEEKSPTDAPCWHNEDEANGWADGFNAACAEMLSNAVEVPE